MESAIQACHDAERREEYRTLDQIADVAETGVDEVEAIIKKKEPAMA